MGKMILKDNKKIEHQKIFVMFLWECPNLISVWLWELDQYKTLANLVSGLTKPNTNI